MNVCAGCGLDLKTPKGGYQIDPHEGRWCLACVSLRWPGMADLIAKAEAILRAERE